MSAALPSVPSLLLDIPGEPTEIEMLAHSIATTRKRLGEVETTLSTTYQRASYDWFGDAADTYQVAGSMAMTANMKLLAYMDQVVQVLEAFAQQIRLGQQYFAEMLDNAAEVGLKVQGKTIHHPTTWLDRIPTKDQRNVSDAVRNDRRFQRPVAQGHPATSITGNVGIREREYNYALTPEFNEFLRYQRLVSTYNEVAAKVGRWHGELEEWLRENMAPLVERVGELDGFATAFESLRQGNEGAVDNALDDIDERVRLNTQWFRVAQGEYSENAFDRLSTALLGNPVTQAVYKGIATEGDHLTTAYLEAGIRRSESLNRTLRGVGDVGVIAEIVATSHGVVHAEVVPGDGLIRDNVDAETIATSFARNTGREVAKRTVVPAGAGLVRTAAISTGPGLVVAGTGQILWEVQVPLKTKDALDHWVDKVIGWDPYDSALKARHHDPETLDYLIDELGPIP